MDRLMYWLMVWWINWLIDRWIDGWFDRWIDGSIDGCAFPSRSFPLSSDTNLSPKSSSSFSGAFDVIASVASDLLMFHLDDERRKETQWSSGRKGESKSSASAVTSSGRTNSNGSPPSAIQHQVLHDIKYYNMLKSRRKESRLWPESMDGSFDRSMHWSIGSIDWSNRWIDWSMGRSIE